MFKRRSLIAVLLLTITLVMTLAFPAGAAEGKIYWVSNESQFISAANSSQDSDIIKLTSDITLSRPVKVNKSVNIDLQGHKLNGSLQYEFQNNNNITNNNTSGDFDFFIWLSMSLIFIGTSIVALVSGLCYTCCNHY